MKRFAPVSLAVLAAACVRPSEPPPEQQTPVATPAPAPAPTATLGPDWRDWPLTPGDWHYARQGDTTRASFGRAGALPDVTLLCDPASRTVTLSRTAPAEANSLSVRTSSGETRHPAAPAGPNSVAARFQASDPTLDAMAFSRGRFIVSAPGARPLVVPAWPEVARVVEDCRS